jgi:hypothetical protein
MATKTKPKKQSLSHDVLDRMQFLHRNYSRGFLQIYYQDLISKFPMMLSWAERKLRIQALKELGYTDYTKTKTVEDDD